METVKTYSNIDRANTEVSFGISKMEDIYKRRNGKTDEPHRHDYFTVLVFEKGDGIHKVDFSSYELGASQIYFVYPGQVHQVIENKSSIGYAITFSTPFLLENAIQISFLDSLNLFHPYGQSPPLLPSTLQFEKIIGFVGEIFQLFGGTSKMKELSIGAFLKLFLIECNNICSINPVESYIDNSENRVIREFKKEVNKAYKEEHSTTYYANQLNITADHLNRIIKSKIGKTAKEYIQSKIITEAKRLLYFSNLSSKQIGFELGFSEPANFSAFFKKCTKLSPSHFKTKEDLN